MKVKDMDSELDCSSTSIVNSPLGKVEVDHSGAAISGIRMEAIKAYAGIPALLQKVINRADMSASTEIIGSYGAVPELLQGQKIGRNDSKSWEIIKSKIDYIYNNLDYALNELERETSFGLKVQSELKKGKKLFFKPNLVAPQVIDPVSHGEGPGAPVCTEWPLMAALMRWFHDKLNINYHQMAL
jgi:hypothetical protein